MAEPFAVRLRNALDHRGPLCVGIDPSGDVMRRWDRPDDVAGLDYVARAILEAALPVAGAVKPQVAFFERFGAAGYHVLERIIREARDASILVIADAKRGDVGSSNVGYAEAWLGDQSPLAVDAVTASPYLGVDALGPLFSRASDAGRAVFVLAATSNDDGREIQEATTRGRVAVEVAVLRALTSVNDRFPGEGVGGAVVGATRSRPDFDLGLLGGPLLVPGVGAQGATLSMAHRLLNGVAPGSFLINVSRAILERGPRSSDLEDAVQRWRDDLAAVFP